MFFFQLKEYQQNHGKKPTKNELNNIESTQNIISSQNEETSSIASSTHSSVNFTQDTQPQSQEHVTQSFSTDANVENSQNYFNTALFQGGGTNHLLSNYFDNLPKNDNFNNNFNQQIEHVSDNNYQKSENIINTTPVEQFVVENGSNNSVMCQNQPSQQNEAYINPDYNYCNSDLQPVEILENVETESAFKEDVDNKETENKLYSNTESLRQLSSQLTSLIESSEAVASVNENSELERRNQELAALLDKESQKNEQLNLQIREYMTRVMQLENECQQVKTDQEAKLSREIGPLQEQLQYHVQTVGILVGEKTELTMSLNQSQLAIKQKTSECEELQSRLRASRHRVGELEKEVNSLKAIRENINKTEQEFSRDIERLKLEYNMLKDQFGELTDECTEFREKLNTKTNENATLQQELQEKNSQLSLAQIRIQQLTVGENLQTESQLEMLNQQKISLEQQVAELTQTIKLVSTERDQASQQYQQYVQQLNTQLQNLASQLQAKGADNENLSKREQSLVKHISELEKHLQQLQTEKQNLVPVVDQTSTLKELEESIKVLKAQKEEIEGNFNRETVNRENLEREIQERDLKIEELEFKVEQAMAEKPDSAKLLAAIESDKVAASRATQQNQQLKNQLTELQEGFVKMVKF